MSDDFGMEKKAAFRPSTVTKGSDNVTRKDNNSTRFHCSNKREPQNGRSAVDFGCKKSPGNGIQKPRMFDNRPRSRGLYLDGQMQEVWENDVKAKAEIGSALQSGSKKANLNHLLNFTLTRRDRGTGTETTRSWHGQNRSSNKKVRYNKEQFLQASCQFIVNESGDYTVHSVDPDILVDWHLIEQVRIYSHEVPSCPICLYPPVAAKVTRCGHIYCWSCILHYLSLEETKTWRKCPICYEAVHSQDIKSVVSLQTHQYTINEEITLKLMKRERGAIYTVPVNQWSESQTTPISLKDKVDTCYSKLLTASTDDITELIEKDRAELIDQLTKEGRDSLEGSFIQSALDKLEERERTLRLKSEAGKEVSAIIEKINITQEVLEKENCKDIEEVKQQVSVTYISAFDEAEERFDSFNEEVTGGEATVIEGGAMFKEGGPTVIEGGAMFEEGGASAEGGGSTLLTTAQSGSVDSVSHSSATNDASVSEQKDLMAIPSDKQHLNAKSAQSTKLQPFYFYQAMDGQHIYLNSLNARCLVKEYGSLANCPPIMTAHILEVNQVSMDTSVRKRFKYLGHLPLTCEFSLVELALKPPIISKETIGCFWDEIEKRRRMRQKKAREERKMVKKMKERSEEKYVGLKPGTLRSLRQFPVSEINVVVETHSEASMSSTSSSSLVSPVMSRPSPGVPTADSEPSDSTTSSDLDPDNMSFAQMLQCSSSKPGGWVRVSHDPVSVTATAPVTKSRHGVTGGGEGSDIEDDLIAPPTYQASFGDAIQQALAKTPWPDDKVNDVANKGKKKKQKKTLLFSTTMSRAK